VQPVFDAIAERAARLCDARHATIFRFDGTHQHFVAQHNIEPEVLAVLQREYPKIPDPGTVTGRALLDGRLVQVDDIESDDRFPVSREIARMVGNRSYIDVPMLRDGRAVGVINVIRREARPFTPSQVEVLQTFADQAVIAIENARLFNEIQEKTRQLEAANRHKDEFLASMSHELRTPLNAVIGFSEVLLERMFGDVNDKQEEYLNDILSSGRHLLSLINDILDLAKIEAGRMELALSDYSVQDTVESVRSTLQPLAADKGLELRAAVPPDIPLAYGDPGRITQCLMNLAGNSLKFTKAGKVEISVAMNDGRLRYCVADTGIGIPPDKIEGLFTEFKQTDATVASEYGGTGLGLSISKKFVEMHGGRIWVESELGRGSAFIFEVPLRAKSS
jgi:signal transduction histidine kinase